MSEASIGVLLPARLETRFKESICQNEEGEEVPCWKLHIAVIPDEPWMARHSGTASQAEIDSLRRLWQACENDAEVLKTTEKGAAAFRRLAQEVGAARAWWLVTTYGPEAEVEAGQKELSRLDALPEQIEIWLGIKEGDEVILKALEPPMEVKREALVFDGEDGSVFHLFGNGRWWTEEAGLQKVYELPFSSEEELGKIELILAVGLGEGSPRALFENHRNAGALSLLPLGAPTNTVSGEPAADLAQDPEVWWRLLGDAGEEETIKDVAQALAGDKAALTAVPGGTREHRRLNDELLNLLWPSLWEHTLRDVWFAGPAQRWREENEPGRRTFSYELGLWAQGLLHPEGPLAPLRIGDQPYGLWPVTRIKGGAWQAENTDPPLEEEWMAPWLAETRWLWAEGARDKSGTVAGADGEHFTTLLGRTPSGSAYGYRTFLPIQAMYYLTRSIVDPGLEMDPMGWDQSLADHIQNTSDALGFPVQPIRRYVTAGWRQDLELPLVEPPYWSHVIGTANGILFLYSATAREGITARLNESGNYEFISLIPGFSAGWTHIVSASQGSLLFYNAESGLAATAWLDGLGGYHYKNLVNGLRAGWTHIAGTAGGGLLFYDASTGQGRTATLDSVGNYSNVGPVANLRGGFSHIVSANQGSLLYYDAETGYGESAWLDGAGKHHFTGPVDGLALWWTHITGTAEGGLLFYNEYSGQGRTAALDSGGNYSDGSPLSGLQKGWTFAGGLVEALFFYRDPADEGASAWLDGSGNYRSGEFMAAVTRNGESTFFTQLEQMITIGSELGFSMMFRGEDKACEALLRSDSLLIRLILNAIARLHAEIGYMRETLDFEGQPHIEPFEPSSNYCTELQYWCSNVMDLNLDMVLDEGFDFLPDIAEWPVVLLYRNLLQTLILWRERYQDALQRVQAGEREAVRELLADIERAFRATLDTAAVRIDPWITGMAWRRLEKLRREGRPDGLGLYAWVDRPYRGTPGPTEGGTLLAPSHDQLLTALIMRDKHINDPQEERWKMEMDSRKVRRAKRLADEVRGGAFIQEVLGRAVEEIAGNKDLIEALRKEFRIREEHDGRRTCDGQKVLELVKPGEEDLAKLQELGLMEHQAALKELAEVVNTYADLLVANGVHAVVSGRPEKAGETMDAAAGLELPPQFDVLRTPRAGYSVNTTVWLALPANTPDPGDSPALLADAAVAAFLEQVEPAAKWVWQVQQGEGRVAVTLADLGLRPSEALAYSEDGLRQLAIRHVDGGENIVERGEDGKLLSPAVPAYRRLRHWTTLLSGHVRDVHNTRGEKDDEGVDQEAEQWEAHDMELLTRFESLIQVADVLVSALVPEQGDEAALIQARRWGIVPGPLDDALDPDEYRLSVEEQLERQLRLARQTLKDRLDRAQALQESLQQALASGDDLPGQQITRAISDLSGNSLPIYGRVRRTMLEVSEPLKPHAALDREWLEAVAAVRPTLARIEAHQLGQEPRLNAWCDAEDPWAYQEVSDEKPVKRPAGVVICYSPAAALGDDLAAAVLDSWSEMVPDKRHIAEVAFGFNAPSSRAPQAILLAVPPDEAKPLDTETLAHIVFEARETAHARMATPEDIEEHAVLFPLVMVPAQGPTGVSMSGDQVVR